MLVKLTDYHTNKPKLINLDNVICISITNGSSSNGSVIQLIEDKFITVKESIDDILMFDNFKIKPDTDNVK